jgi:hypothetical protein
MLQQEGKKSHLMAQLTQNKDYNHKEFHQTNSNGTRSNHPE